ncbi:hypothetical protein ACS0TY_015519 [Phlomoides rotata]
MQTYLTDVWNLSFTHAAAILNIWGGISWILPLLFLFLADAHTGNFKMVVISSIADSVGIMLVTMSTPPILTNSTGSCKEYEAQCISHTKRVMFYAGMALLAMGIGGHRASLKPYNDESEAYSSLPMLFCVKLPLILFVSLTTIAGFFVFPYIKQWYLLFGVPGICVVCAILLFFSGRYKHGSAEARGSPLTDVCRVFVAAALKISQPFPADTKHIYQYDDEAHNSFPPSRFLRWLEKAAIILPDVSLEDQVRNRRWRLCSFEEVEAAKFLVRVIPIGATFVVCTIVSSVGNTFLVEQGSRMNRKIGKWKVPSQVLLALFFLGKKYFFDNLADSLVKKSRIYGPPRGIAVAMLLSVLCCVTAAVIEVERLKVVKHHGLLNKPDEAVPMAAYWLFFPFFLLAGLDSFIRKGVVAFYKRGSPEGMKRYCEHFADAVSGLGLVYSVISVRIVGKISEMGGREGWFQDNLNKSRLDLYYWALAGLSALNLLVFFPLVSLHRYKSWETKAGVVDGVQSCSW